MANSSALKKHKSAQVSMEYLTITGFTTILLIITLGLSVFYISSSQDNIALSQSKKITDILIDNAQSIYYIGPPSKTTIKLYMPTQVESITINQNYVRMKVHTKTGLTDVVSSGDINVSGYLSPKSGIKKITIEAKEGYVWISQ